MQQSRFVTYWLFVSVFHCIFMIYPWTANGMSWCSRYLWETRESGDERKEQKQENGVIDLIWILLSAVRVMMMMWVPVRLQARSHAHNSAHTEKVTDSKCALTLIYGHTYSNSNTHNVHTVYIYASIHWHVLTHTHIMLYDTQPAHTCTIKWPNDKKCLVTSPPRGVRQ